MKSSDIVETALEIQKEYQDQGLSLTLRQMYYQFVSRGLIGSGQKEYKALGDALTKARYNGTFPIGGLEDRGRSFQSGDFSQDYTDLEIAIRQAGRDLESADLYMQRSRWWGQPESVTVLFEKEALLGVFEGVCRELGVGYMACKGYPSVSSVAQWIRSAREVETLSYLETHTILYLGDHDPDGFGITRSLEDSIGKLRQLDGYGLESPVRIERIALSMDQIRQFDPPPFDAKESSPRFRRYVEEHETLDAWELDALSPTVLRDLIRDSVKPHFCQDIDIDNIREVEKARLSVRSDSRYLEALRILRNSK